MADFDENCEKARKMWNKYYLWRCNLLYSRERLDFFLRKGDVPALSFFLSFSLSLSPISIAIFRDSIFSFPLLFFSRDIAFVRKSRTKIKEKGGLSTFPQQFNRGIVSPRSPCFLLTLRVVSLLSFSNPESNSLDTHDVASPDILNTVTYRCFWFAKG